MCLVKVLMSTYNGEKYLREQIDSILEQELVTVKLLVRDDGSSDSTLNILADYPDISVIKGRNIGVGKSFMTLLTEAGDADYYAFSDQDDVWHKDKLIRAIEAIKKSDKQGKPILYGCNQRCIDSEGQFLYTRFPSDYKLPVKEECLFRNDIPGCTMVINKAYKKILVEKMPDFELFSMQIHDIWISEVASFAGEVIFDNTSTIDFRRHGNNFSQEVISETNYKSKLTLLCDRFKRTYKGHIKKGGISKAAEQLLLLYSEYMSENEIKNLELIKDYKVSFKRKLQLLHSNMFSTCVSENRMYFIIKIVFNVL